MADSSSSDDYISDELSDILRTRSYASFSKVHNLNEKEIKEFAGQYFEYLIKLYDYHSQYIEYYRWTFYKRSNSETIHIEHLIIAVLTRNVNMIYSMIKLTEKGEFGMVKSLARQTLELLMLSKYCAATRDNAMAERWLNGGEFNLYKDCIRNLKVPNKKEMSEFWRMLCKFTHGTTFSQQSTMYWRLGENNDVSLCLSFIRIFILCNYHLFNTVYLGLSAFSRNNGKRFNEEDVDFAKTMFNEAKDYHHPYMGKASKLVVRDYCRKWQC